MASTSNASAAASAVDSDEDEMDWEEVDVPDTPSVRAPGNIEITLNARAPSSTKKKGIASAASYAERRVRIECHKIHTVCLLANAWTRNRWINDRLLHARLMSLTPLSLQNAFATIHSSRVPDAAQRGRLFENAITQLALWWSESFFDVLPAGHIRSRTFDEIAPLIFGKTDEDVQEMLEGGVLADGEEGEPIRSAKSLMKHALMRCGSRDVSAQLFTALCRALGIPARLVVSIQSVPWQASVGKPKPKYSRKDKKGKGKEKARDDGDGEGEGESDMEEVQISDSDKTFSGVGQRLDGGSVTMSEKAKGKMKAKPIIKLRKTKSNGQRLGASSAKTGPADPTSTPPVFWTEVFSRADARWLPVDPIRCIVNKRKAFDPGPAGPPTVPSIYTALGVIPTGSATPPKEKAKRKSGMENRLSYVVAFEEDGYARDVTARYAREYGAKIVKLQGGATTGKARGEWWMRVCGIVRRPFRLHRDDLEDEELESHQLTEAMPTTISGFKDHPLYVLPRHIKRDEVLDSPTELGTFRGEPVYARSAVLSLRSAETWMRSGRRVRAGEQPMKSVKTRAGTIRGLRAIEALKEAGATQEGAGEAMQGLYARRQTGLYVPPPIVDGKVPKNDFGNIDLYVPSMLPAGGVHIPFKGVAKVARRLKIDYAEAVTGFEFKQRRALPILEGVVVAAEHEPALIEAYWDAEQEARAKAQAKREERVRKRWIRLIHGLRIRQRLLEQYATQPPHEVEGLAGRGGEGGEDESVPQAGGFLVGADDVVQAFHMPKYLREMHPEETGTLPTTSYAVNKKPGSSSSLALRGQEGPLDMTVVIDGEEQDDDDEDDMEELVIAHSQERASDMPILSMRELATRRQENTPDDAVDGVEENIPLSPPPPPQLTAEVPAKKRTHANNGQTMNGGSGAASPLTKRGGPSRRSSTRKRGRKVTGDSDAGNEEEDVPIQSKRARTSKTAAVATPAPTRVLRERKSKTSAQIREEKEREDAYRKAIQH